MELSTPAAFPFLPLQVCKCAHEVLEIVGILWCLLTIFFWVTFLLFSEITMLPLDDMLLGLQMQVYLMLDKLFEYE